MCAQHLPEINVLGLEEKGEHEHQDIQDQQIPGYRRYIIENGKHIVKRVGSWIRY